MMMLNCAHFVNVCYDSCGIFVYLYTTNGMVVIAEHVNYSDFFSSATCLLTFVSDRAWRWKIVFAYK